MGGESVGGDSVSIDSSVDSGDSVGVMVWVVTVWVGQCGVGGEYGW